MDAISKARHEADVADVSERRLRLKSLELAVAAVGPGKSAEVTPVAAAFLKFLIGIGDGSFAPRAENFQTRRSAIEHMIGGGNFAAYWTNPEAETAEPERVAVVRDRCVTPEAATESTIPLPCPHQADQASPDMPQSLESSSLD